VIVQLLVLELFNQKVCFYILPIVTV